MVAWDSNPGRQDGRRRQFHRAMDSPPHHFAIISRMDRSVDANKWTERKNKVKRRRRYVVTYMLRDGRLSSWGGGLSRALFRAANASSIHWYVVSDKTIINEWLKRSNVKKVPLTCTYQTLTLLPSLPVCQQSSRQLETWHRFVKKRVQLSWLIDAEKIIAWNPICSQDQKRNGVISHRPLQHVALIAMTSSSICSHFSLKGSKYPT